MSVTLQINAPLHFYSCLYMDPTLLHQAIKNQYNATLNYRAIAKYVPKQISNMPLK